MSNEEFKKMQTIIAEVSDVTESLTTLDLFKLAIEIRRNEIELVRNETLRKLAVEFEIFNHNQNFYPPK